jgi:1-acyl-sn-glycerol-3-phosphate acyltransferase
MNEVIALRAAAATPARPSWLARLLLTPWLWTLLLVLGSFSLLWNLLALPLLALPVPLGRRVGRAAIAHGYRLYWIAARASGLLRVEASALDALRSVPGGMVIAANHPSMLDAVAIVSRLPRAVCIMKASLMRNPFLSAGAQLACYITNDHSVDMLRRAVDELHGGAQLVLFPEGTRTVHGRLNRFGQGVGLIARRAGVPVQTVIIETDSPYLGKHWPIWKLPPLPMVFHLRLGRRFEPEDDPQHFTALLEQYFLQELDR